MVSSGRRIEARILFLGPPEVDTGAALRAVAKRMRPDQVGALAATTAPGDLEVLVLPVELGQVGRLQVALELVAPVSPRVAYDELGAAVASCDGFIFLASLNPVDFEHAVALADQLDRALEPRRVQGLPPPAVFVYRVGTAEVELPLDVVDASLNAAAVPRFSLEPGDDRPLLQALKEISKAVVRHRRALGLEARTEPPGHAAPAETPPEAAASREEAVRVSFLGAPGAADDLSPAGAPTPAEAPTEARLALEMPALEAEPSWGHGTAAAGEEEPEPALAVQPPPGATTSSLRAVFRFQAPAPDELPSGEAPDTGVEFDALFEATLDAAAREIADIGDSLDEEAGGSAPEGKGPGREPGLGEASGSDNGHPGPVRPPTGPAPRRGPGPRPEDVVFLLGDGGDEGPEVLVDLDADGLPSGAFGAAAPAPPGDPPAPAAGRASPGAETPRTWRSGDRAGGRATQPLPPIEVTAEGPRLVHVGVAQVVSPTALELPIGVQLADGTFQTLVLRVDVQRLVQPMVDE